MSSPELHLIANAHLDPIWLWELADGKAEILQTFASAADRLDEFPGLCFTCSSAAYYRLVEELDPCLFERIRAHVASGRWVPVNGWDVQPDCNLPSGESFARHALYSQRYFREKFGRVCKTGYNIDSFGHSGALPQLLLASGMNAYVFMRPSSEDGPGIPMGPFVWRGFDGSEVLAYHLAGEYGNFGSAALDAACDAAREAGGCQMVFFGVGNHGGGPTRHDIIHLQGVPDARFSSPDEYFDSIAGERRALPVYTGDLHHHAPGAYATLSEVKLENRRAEALLPAAETLAWMAGADVCERIRRAWLNVLFNQFHDIAGGCAIREAYDRVFALYGEARAIGSDIYENAALSISRGIDTFVPGASDPCEPDIRHYASPRHVPLHIPRPIVVFNPSAFPVRAAARAYHPSDGVTDSAGRPVLFQNVPSVSPDTGRDTLFSVDLPPLGYEVYWLRWLWNGKAEPDYALPSPVRAGENFIDNGLLRLEIDPETGEIASLASKGEAYLSRCGAPLVVNDDGNPWGSAENRWHDVRGLMKAESVRLIESGPLRASIAVTHRFGGSYLLQTYRLTAGEMAVRVECKALWQEDDSRLKLAFALPRGGAEFTNETQFSHAARPTDGLEQPIQRWADLAHSGKGVALITLGRCSCESDGRAMRLTALRNVPHAGQYFRWPEAETSRTDEGLHRFSYALLCHDEPDFAALTRFAEGFAAPPFSVPESYHHGERPARFSFGSVSGAAVAALKRGEDGGTALRVYDAGGSGGTAEVSLGGAEFSAALRPFEVKTFIISNGAARECGFLE